jgi:hypothetical protein
MPKGGVVPWLDFIDSLDEKIRGKAVDVDRQHVQQKVDKVVDITIRLILLHSGKQCHDDLTEIWLKSVSAVPIHLATQKVSRK